MAPKFIIIPNSGSGDCYYLSVLDSINNKNLSKKFLHFMGKKYIKKTKGNVITVQILRDYISDHSDQFLYHIVSSLLNIPDDHKSKKYFSEEDVENRLKPYIADLKEKANIVIQFGTKVAAYINEYMLTDKKIDNETKRINFVKYYKKMIKTQYKWVCFLEVCIFELLYTKFIKSEFKETGCAVCIHANDEYIKQTPMPKFETDKQIYLNYKNLHYEAWVFNNNSNSTLKKIRLKHNKATQKLKNINKTKKK